MNQNVHLMRFPHYILNPMHGMTVRDRVAKYCEYSLLKQFPKFRISPPVTSEDYIYRSLVSANSLAMSIYSLGSLAQCAVAMPRIQLCVDESLDAEEVPSVFARHGLSVEAWDAKRLDAEMESRGEKTLQRFAKAHLFGRKMAFTFGLGDEGSVLYADTDVLWFKDPRTTMGLGSLNSLLAGTDGHHSYDKEVIDRLSQEHRRILLESAPVCAGLYAVGGCFSLPAVTLEYIEIQLAAGQPGYFCEQTLLALTVKLVGLQVAFSELPTCPATKSVWRPAYRGNEWIACHYAGPTRPQFWLDAWSLVQARN